MSHTPQQIADLARAARDRHSDKLAIYARCNAVIADPQESKATKDMAICEKRAARRLSVMANGRFTSACTPATILALCERLRLASAAIPDYSPDFPASAEYMNRPLTPEARP